MRVLSRIDIIVEPPTAVESALTEINQLLQTSKFERLEDSKAEPARTPGELYLFLQVTAKEDELPENLAYNIADRILEQIPRFENRLSTGSNFMIPA